MCRQSLYRLEQAMVFDGGTLSVEKTRRTRVGINICNRVAGLGGLAPRREIAPVSLPSFIPLYLSPIYIFSSWNSVLLSPLTSFKVVSPPTFSIRKNDLGVVNLGTVQSATKGLRSIRG